LLGLLCCATIADDQETEPAKPEPEGFVFTGETSLPCTPVKSQARTGTCWSFATSSFLESELIRMGKGEYDLSEMFVVRNTYPQKVQLYARLHGNSKLGPGGVSGDLLQVFRDFGAVPEGIYDGKFAGESRHNHSEMDAMLGAMLEVVVSNKGGSLSPAWPAAVEGLLDAYLGNVPEEFTWDGRRYTPRTFADSLGFDPGQYVEFTSCTHHPFYQEINLEIPDNWADHLYWNVPLDELMAIIDRSFELGYTVCWGGDTSEKGFKQKKGVAILPVREWEDRTEDEQKAICDVPEPEVVVTQEIRQRYFDDYETTDDHVMHLVGTAHDQNGTRYYRTKNSWGTKDSKHDGFLYLSKAYVRGKTTTILVHRRAVPEAIASKLGL
jgi:bleomycin hydrolase